MIDELKKLLGKIDDLSYRIQVIEILINANDDELGMLKSRCESLLKAFEYLEAKDEHNN